MHLLEVEIMVVFLKFAEGCGPLVEATVAWGFRKVMGGGSVFFFLFVVQRTSSVQSLRSLQPPGNSQTPQKQGDSPGSGAAR